MLALTLREQKKLPEAEQTAREWIDVEGRFPPGENFAAFTARRFLVHVLTEERKYPEAEAAGRQLLKLQRAAFGATHFMVAETLYNLACVAALTHQNDKALSLLTDALSHGFGRDEVAEIKSDPDMQSIRNDPRFAAALARAK